MLVLDKTNNLLLKNISKRTCLYTEKWICYPESDPINIVGCKKERQLILAPKELGLV